MWGLILPDAFKHILLLVGNSQKEHTVTKVHGSGQGALFPENVETATACKTPNPWLKAARCRETVLVCCVIEDSEEACPSVSQGKRIVPGCHQASYFLHQVIK